MHLTKLTVERASAVALIVGISVALLISTVRAQKPSPEQKPDVSNKALITKQTPDSKKKPAETGAVKRYTIEQFMATIRLGGASFSADEKSVLFHSNKTGIFNVYSMPVVGGEAKQLTNSPTQSLIFPPTPVFFIAMTRAATKTNTFICASSMGPSAT